MNGQPEMTVLQMYAQLQQLGLQPATTVPAIYTMPSAYHYVPTQVVYSTAEDYAELVRDPGGDPERAAIWGSEEAAGV